MPTVVFLGEGLVDAAFILKNENPFAGELVEKGLGAIPELMRVLINNAIRQTHLCWQVIRLLRTKDNFIPNFQKKVA